MQDLNSPGIQLWLWCRTKNWGRAAGRGWPWESDTKMNDPCTTANYWQYSGSRPWKELLFLLPARVGGSCEAKK